MNKDTAAQYLPLVQALAEGKTLQLNSGGNWRDESDVIFSFPPNRYRIKPEPRKIWTINSVTLEGFCVGVYHSSDGETRKNVEQRLRVFEASYPDRKYKIREFVEVIENGS